VPQPGSSPDPAVPPGRLSAQGQPELLAGGLVLRAWRLADAPALVRAYADPDIHRWHCRSLSLPEAQAWIAFEAERWAQEHGGSWAITRNGVPQGRVGLGGVSLAEARAGVTYWVLPEARGRGVATRALAAVAEWAFGVASLHRLELDHSTQNVASCRVATKAGFTVEGTKREQGLHLDGWHDMHAHAQLAGDRRPGRRTG
jgi:RimJ/RimL family protein N-acetyltransferase